MKISFRLKPLFLAIAAAGIALPALAERQSSIQPALVYVNGLGYFKYDGNDVIKEAAHYPLILGASRWTYQRPYPNSSEHPYELIHELNPATRITNYANGPHARYDASEYDTAWLNGIARWSESRGHPDGRLWYDHGPCDSVDEWFLLKSGTPTSCSSQLFVSYGTGASTTYWLDFGSQDVREYWAAATINDLLYKIHDWPHPDQVNHPGQQHPLDPAAVYTDRPWKTDGLFIDTTSLDDPSDTTTKYDATQWNDEMSTFIEYATETIRSDYPDQDMYFNTGGAGETISAAGWAYLDGLPSTSRPTGLLEEDAFVVAYGANEAQFWPETKWLTQVATLRATGSMNAVFESHTDMLPLDGRDEGLDMNGRPVTYWGAFWYAMSSYLLGKNDVDGNSYFAFYHKGNNGADALYLSYPDENDLDIGKAVGEYAAQSIAATDSSTISIYKREFEKGWVFVNPNGVNSASFTLPELGKPIDHATFLDPIGVANTGSLAIPANRGIVVLKDRLLGDWRFDASSGSTAVDSHEYLPGDSMDGTAYGSPTWLPGAGVVDGALQFDGSNDYVAVAHHTDRLVTPDELSISLWVKPDSGSSGNTKATVLQFGTWRSSGWQLLAGADWNEFRFHAYGGSAVEQYCFKPFQSPLPTNAWSHLTVTVENKADGNVKMYLNGAPFHACTLTAPFNSSTSDTLYIGAKDIGLGSVGYWGGKMDNAKIQRKVLSPYEVAAEYRAQLGDWRLDEPKYRRKAFDRYGSAHGTVHGDPTWLGSGGSGAPAGSIELDGIDDEIVIDHNIAQLQQPKQFTLNAWVQPSATPAVSGAMQYTAASGDTWVLFVGPGANDIALQLSDGSSPQAFVVDAPTPINLSTTTWNRLTVTVDNKAGGEVKIYVNGASVPLNSSTLTAPITLSEGTLRMGASDYGYWKGKLGHVQLFSRILNATEISQLTD